jgi:hypothetical protein
MNKGDGSDYRIKAAFYVQIRPTPDIQLSGEV